MIVDFMIFTFVVAWIRKRCLQRARQTDPERIQEGRGEKPRVARDDDQWLVGQRWVMVDLPRVDGEPLVQSKVAWGVGKGDGPEAGDIGHTGIETHREEAKPKVSPKAAVSSEGGLPRKDTFLVINVFDCMALQVFPLLVFSLLKVLLMCASRFLFVGHVMWCFVSVLGQSDLEEMAVEAPQLPE